jgi:hypothetical protein
MEPMPSVAGLPLSFGRFTVTLAPEQPLRLPPYAGGMFRGAFGLALQRVVCVTRTYECPPCALRDRCIYPYVFETPPPSSTRVMRKYPAAPHPFVLEPPGPGGAVLPAGRPFPVGLTLFGKALRYLPHFVYAFEQVGKVGLGSRRVRCGLRAVEAGLDGRRWTLYSPEDPVFRTADPFEEHLRLELSAPEGGEPGASSRVSLALLTPLRIVYEERLSGDLPFHVLIRSLLRRLAHLSYFHCGGDPRTVAFRDWIALAQGVRVTAHALAWRDWERYSSRQQTTMTLGGLVGTVTYAGNLAPFLPLLRLGQVIHAGKGTSFGLGRYRLVEDGSPAIHAEPAG